MHFLFVAETEPWSPGKHFLDSALLTALCYIQNVLRLFQLLEAEVSIAVIVEAKSRRNEAGLSFLSGAFELRKAGL